MWGYRFQNCGLENQVSSTTTSAARGTPVNRTAAVEDVNTTLVTEATLLHEFRTFSVPFIAGSSSSAYMHSGDSENIDSEVIT